MRKGQKADGAAAPRAAEIFAASGRLAVLCGGRARGDRPAGLRCALLGFRLLLKPQVRPRRGCAFSTPHARGARTSSRAGMRGGRKRQARRARRPSRPCRPARTRAKPRVFRPTSACPTRAKPRVSRPCSFAREWGELKAHPLRAQPAALPHSATRVHLPAPCPAPRSPRPPAPFFPLVALASLRRAFLSLVLRGGVPAHRFPALQYLRKPAAFAKNGGKVYGT